MGNGASGRHRTARTVKRRTRASLVVRFVGRVGATALALLVFTLVAIQFARVIHQNIALSSELSAAQNDITRLQAHRDWQMRQLRRLQDPPGAIPEIHDRLRLVRANEAIVFVSPLPSPQATSTP
jgi:cell division protein FtsB